MKGPFTKGRHGDGAVSGTGVKVREGNLNVGKKQDGEVHRPGAVASADGGSPPNSAWKEPSECHHLLLLHLLTSSSSTDQTAPTGAGRAVSVRGAAWGEGARRSGGTNRRHGILLTPSHGRLLLPLDEKHFWVHHSGSLPRIALMREHPALGLAPCASSR